MALDYSALVQLRQNHPAWRLLCAEHAPLVAGFLHRVFVVPNARGIAAVDLAEALEDELFAAREQLSEGTFPKAAIEYLNDWAAADKGWLRKYYPKGTDEPHFDLTPSTEKAIAWLAKLSERSFVGTESRLLTLFELLKQMSEGSETNPHMRIAELQKRRDEIDIEIVRVRSGDLPMLDSTALKDRFQQFVSMARELLADFREVEQNFRQLDRRARERIALWEGSKGALLAEIMGERDAIADSDQGRSFRAFWDFLMSSSRQEELSVLLDKVLALAPVLELKPDARTRRVHYDWLEAGEHTQRTVAQLSQQLRQFLDDQAWLENRRIMDILRGIEAKALAVRQSPPVGELMTIADTAADIELPMERPLYSSPVKPLIANVELSTGDAELDTAALFSQIVIDKARLSRHIRHALQDRAQITLAELCQIEPLQDGLAELVAYLQIATEQSVAVAGKTDRDHEPAYVHGAFKTVVDESMIEAIVWQRAANGQSSTMQARLPRVIFVR